MPLKSEDSGETLQDKGTITPTRAAGKPFGNPLPQPQVKPAPASTQPKPRLDPDSKASLS